MERRRQVLITRPREDAEPLADLLEGHGFATLIEPLLEITMVDGPAFDLSGIQALVMTSANGVRAFTHRDSRRDLPVYAVGMATAAEATAAGFQRVTTAGGNVDALAAALTENLDPIQGPIFHPAGSVQAGDLGTALRQAGFGYRRDACYHAAIATRLSDTVATAFLKREIDHVLLYSPRTARTFCTCASDSGCADHLDTVVAHCLSEAVAVAASSLAWRRMVTVARPDQGLIIQSLIDENE